MSLRYVLDAFKAKVGNSSRKLVLIKLADNANDDGICWPSYQHIADHCEMSKRSVMSHVKKLVEMGFLTITYRKKEDGNNQSNLFKLHIPSESISPPSENISPPPSENISPRTCHSLEPVNEPIIVQKDLHQEGFDYFWSNMKLRKVNKKKGLAAFKKACGKTDSLEFAQKLLTDINQRFDKQYGFNSMHPATYLNGERWNDELPTDTDSHKQMNAFDQLNQKVNGHDQSANLNQNQQPAISHISNGQDLF